jgi:hypothetical protein
MLAGLLSLKPLQLPPIFSSLAYVQLFGERPAKNLPTAGPRVAKSPRISDAAVATDPDADAWISQAG